MKTVTPPRSPLGLWPALFLVTCFVIPVWLAMRTDVHPGTSHWDHLWENLPLLGGLLLFVLTPSPFLRSAYTLSNDQMRCFRYAIRTGTLPLASLFSDWTTDLMGSRRSLETLLNALPAAILVSAGSTAYATSLVHGSYTYFLTSAASSVFLGIVLFKLAAVRLRNICLLQEQLQVQAEYLAMT